MRKLLILAFCAVAAGCSSATEPSSEGSSLGSSLNIAGAWTGVLTSSNNPSETITMQLAQTSGNITGTWQGTEIAWSGQVSGSLSSGSFNGQMTFTGIALDGRTCTGTATVSGSASSSTLTWTSSVGVVGAPCGAPLPTGIAVDMSR
jgi:hypothetical protein